MNRIVKVRRAIWLGAMAGNDGWERPTQACKHAAWKFARKEYSAGGG